MVGRLAATSPSSGALRCFMLLPTIYGLFFIANCLLPTAYCLLPTASNPGAPMPQQDKPVWFITGCSTGFGRELAKFTLDRGYRVVVTARNTADVADLAEMEEH